MGFTTGFTGGFTLTLSIAYLTVLAHQRNREQQAAILRQQTHILSGIVDPLPPALPPSRAELAAAERANLVETAKDRWNAEIEGAVRWAQTKDWEEVREGVETALGRLWAKAFSDAREEAEKGERKGVALARGAEDKAAREISKGKDVAREKAAGVSAAAKSAYADAKAKNSDVVSKTEEKAGEAKGSLFGAIGKGIEKGKEAFGKAKSAVGVAEEKAGAVLNEDLSPVSPVQKALNQRYEKPSGLKENVEEVLAKRYVPDDQKDNTQLKAI